jgi:hypothetical protein
MFTFFGEHMLILKNAGNAGKDFSKLEVCEGDASFDVYGKDVIEEVGIQIFIRTEMFKSLNVILNREQVAVLHENLGEFLKKHSVPEKKTPVMIFGKI